MKEGIIRDIVMKTVSNYVNEELSVNNELEVSVNGVCDEIIKKFETIDRHEYQRTGVTLSDGSMGLISSCSFNVDLEFMRKMFRCLVKVYIFWDEQTLMEFYEDVEIGGEFNQSDDFFTFVLPSLDGKQIDRQFMFNTIYHEVEHSLQYLMIGDKTVKNSYKLALILMDGNIPRKLPLHSIQIIQNNIEIARLIGTVYYNYYPLEMDANINGLYGELVENGLKLKETNYWVEKMTVEKQFNRLLNLGENEEINEIYKLFGFNSANQFSKYIRKQQDYLVHKEMKVMQRAINHEKLNESIRFISHHSRPPYIYGITPL